jgi:hypothetical protein
MDTLAAPGNQGFNPALLEMSEQSISILSLDLIIPILPKSAQSRNR